MSVTSQLHFFLVSRDDWNWCHVYEVAFSMAIQSWRPQGRFDFKTDSIPLSSLLHHK